MIWDVINPSDAYTMKSDDFECAALATLYLARGAYALEPLDGGDKSLPLFVFSGEDDLSKWWNDNFGHDLSKSFEVCTGEKLPTLLACLDSVMIGTLKDRELWESALKAITDDDKRKAFIEEWHDKKRTSISDFGSLCRKWSDKLRRNHADDAAEGSR